MPRPKRRSLSDGCVALAPARSSSVPRAPVALPPLVAVACVLQNDDRLSSLTHVALQLTELLDRSHEFSLQTAAASGFVSLFDRVACRIERDAEIESEEKTSHCELALQSAIERDDLRMIQRIYAFHTEPLNLDVQLFDPWTSVPTIGLVFNYCSLETLQWITAARPCCVPDEDTSILARLVPSGPRKQICGRCLQKYFSHLGGRDADRIINWLLESQIFDQLDDAFQSWQSLPNLWVAMQHSTRLVQWIHDREPQDESTMWSLLRLAVQNSRTEQALWLLKMLEVCLTVQTNKTENGPRKWLDRLLGRDRLSKRSRDTIYCLVMAACNQLDEVVEKFVQDHLCDEFNSMFLWTCVEPGGGNVLQWDAKFMKETQVDGRESLADFYCKTASSLGQLDTLKWLYHHRGILPDYISVKNNVKDDGLRERISKWIDEIQEARLARTLQRR